MEDSDAVFDRVLHSVGEDGSFQRRHNIIFNFMLAFFGTMVYMNIILPSTIPDHWCLYPGRGESSDTNFTLEEWKEMTLPRENNSHGQNVFSSCKMYNITDVKSLSTSISIDTEVIDCIYGYEYDTTWYTTTIPTSENWVCEKALRASNMLAVSKVAEIIGAVILGFLGDLIGRRPVFFIALTLMATGRLVAPYVVEWYPAFVIVIFISSLSSTSMAQSCLVTSMEFSSPENRAFLALIQNLGWTLGICALPLIFWLIRDWKIYFLVTTSPLLLCFALSILLIESPRWLLSRGRVSECLKQLQYIAKVNGTKLSPDSALMLQNSKASPEKVYGMLSLFSNWRMTKNSIMLALIWMSVMVGYCTLTLNVTTLGGNPFLNFFIQAIAEIPSYLLGRYLCDWIGRRFSAAIGFIISMIGYIVLCFTMNDPNLEWVHICMVGLSKSAISMAYFVVSIQGLEIYPTSVRQSANSFGLTTGQIFVILGPYIVYLGSTVDSRLPSVILLVITVIGLIAEIFLPETLHERLPETLHEAQHFGMDQDYWSFPRKKTDPYILVNLKFIKRQYSENYEKD